MTRADRLRAAIGRSLPKATPLPNGVCRITAGRWTIWANAATPDATVPHLAGVPLSPDRAYAEFDGEPAGWFPFAGTSDAGGSVYHRSATIDDLLAALEGGKEQAA